MRILQINAVNQIGSTGRNVSETADFLQREGHTCAVAYSVGPTVHSEIEFHIGSAVDTKLHGLLSRVSGKQGYFSKRATRKLLSFTDKFAPDVVVLHNLHANYIHLPMLLRYLAEKDIATVAVLHDCWFYTGKCCHYTVEGCYKWQERCGNCPALKKYNISWFFDKTAEMLADKKALFGAIPRLGVVGVSDWLTGEAQKAPVFQNAKVLQRIYNWVDTDLFIPQDTTALRAQMGLQNKQVLLCVASGWSKAKGLDTVLRLAERLTKEQILLLVGNAPQEQLTDPHIRYIPATNDTKELAALYAMADVFVQPSLEETFGKVTAEALSCGTPVVCFDSTANPELVGEGCGTVVPVGDVQAMNNAIQQILKQGKEAFSPNCRNYAVEHFQKGKNLKEYLNLFEILCKY